MSLIVSYRTINEIRPHTNAERLEIAVIDGWQCVVGKGEFKAGDKVIYFQEGAILPEIPPFEFLKDKGYRIRVIKIRGVLSSGYIVQPKSIIKYFPKLREINSETVDLSDFIPVKRYEKEVFEEGNNSENSVKWPFFIKKTGMERLQNIINEPSFLSHKEKDTSFVITEKLDGCSLTVYYDFLNPEDSRVCSKNVCYDLDAKSRFVFDAKELGILETASKMASLLNGNVILQGELCGPGIQKNQLKLDAKKFFLYQASFFENQYASLFDFVISNHPYELQIMIEDVESSLSVVPFVEERTINSFSSVEEMISFADRSSLVNPNVIAEGVVFNELNRVIPVDPSEYNDFPSEYNDFMLRNYKSSELLKFKVISNNYLLK